MTDLEQVREQLERQLYALGNDDPPTKVALSDLDAHLKEDAEKERLQKALPSYYEQQTKRLEAELTELRAKARRVDHAEANLEKENEFTSKLLAELTELREAARDFWEARDWKNTVGPAEYHRRASRLRQLIEEKP